MATGNFIAYYRVSTDKQGKSGLGLEAQREAVTRYLNGGEWKLVAEYTEIETGTSKRQRPQLAAALDACRLYGATLVFAKWDRLSRDVAVTSNLLKSGIAFVATDNAYASRTHIQMMSVFAEAEAEAISQRTKAALAAKRAKGEPTGAQCWKSDKGLLSAADRAKGQAMAAEALRADRLERWGRVAPMIRRLHGEGQSLRGIARELNRLDIPTARGREWSAVLVGKILQG